MSVEPNAHTHRHRHARTRVPQGGAETSDDENGGQSEDYRIGVLTQQLERANAPSWARLDPCWSRDTKQGEQYEYVDTGASLRA